MKHDDKSDFGTIKIHKEAIMAIAERAALEVHGVARLSKSSNKFLDNLGLETRKGVKVEIDEASEVKITVFVIAKYGFYLSEVARLIQENIRAAMEKMTDLTLREINVDVKGIDNAK